MTEPPLTGLTVLDLSRLLPGGYATLLMADLGADVLKVEEPGRGDGTRWFPPFAADGQSGMHHALNRGKRSLTLDLRAPEGREILLELAATADVLIESYRPGVMDRLGLGYDVLREANPGLVYVAITGYGYDGPYRDVAGHDIDYLAYAGALSFTGSPAGPHQPGLQIADIGGGAMLAVIAALTALRVREQTGQGQFCDVSMTDGVLSWLSLHAGAFTASGELPQPGGGLLGGGYACYRVYACADGRHVAVGALEPKFFAEVLAVLGLPELMDAHLDPARQADLRARLEAAFATRGRDEWMQCFAGRDACVAPVLDLGEALSGPQALARGMVDGAGRLGVVPRFAATPGRAGGLPSTLGGDTDAVLAALGRTPEQVSGLRAAGVV
ncbi:MAG: CoA transferase [Actinomycetota bacterium]|nr:CoA transferase [Actinomycetota bacterium]